MTSINFPTSVLEPLLRSPQLPLYARQIELFLNEEQTQREEFYNWLTEDIKAEFINGEVIVQSPAKDRHTAASMNLSTLLSTFVQLYDLGLVRAETALITLTRNDYLPDVCYFGAEKAAQIAPDQMKYPPPDFIVEILSASTERTDRETKFVDYAAHGVAEYWLVNPEDKTVEQYLLRHEAYELQLKVRTGLLSAVVVEGFEIPVKAIFDTAMKNQALHGLFLAGGRAG